MFGNQDPNTPTHTAISGRKGEGKTELLFLLFSSWPRDRVLIDPNGDIKLDSIDYVDLVEPVPSRWPAHLFEQTREKAGARRRTPQTLRYVPNLNAPDHIDQMDRVVGLAHSHPNTLLAVDEAQILATSTYTPPHTRTALWQGRHLGRLSSIWAMPRTKKIDPLVISQADYGYFFKLHNRADRDVVAENIDRDKNAFSQDMAELPRYGFLGWEANPEDEDDELLSYPPLPKELIRHHRS